MQPPRPWSAPRHRDHEDRYLGTAEALGDGLVVRNGYRGHPVTVPLGDVVNLGLARGRARGPAAGLALGARGSRTYPERNAARVRTKDRLIKPRRAWKGIEHLEIATAEWVDWFNHPGPFEFCDDLTPVEADTPTTFTSRPQ